jgi:hypothetical protein
VSRRLGDIDEHEQSLDQRHRYMKQADYECK